MEPLSLCTTKTLYVPVVKNNRSYARLILCCSTTILYNYPMSNSTSKPGCVIQQSVNDIATTG